MPGPPPQAGSHRWENCSSPFNHRGNFPVRRLRETSSFGQGRGAFESINLRCRRFYFTRSLVTRVDRSRLGVYTDFLLLFAERTGLGKNNTRFNDAFPEDNAEKYRGAAFSLSLSSKQDSFIEQTSPFIAANLRKVSTVFLSS